MGPPGGSGHSYYMVWNSTRYCVAVWARSRILVLLAGLWVSFQGLLVAGALQKNGVRLVKGPNNCAGTIEVLYNGQWGTVCDDGWGLEEARVVCQELGCGKALSAPGSARFGQGSGPIWLDDVNCVGTEEALSMCTAKAWGEHNCNHGEDAAVVCSEPPPLRLVNGSSRCSGRVEVLHDQQWGSVCGNGWDMRDAQVVCRQLGCGTAISTSSSAHFGQGHDPIWLDGVDCTGAETSLAECRASPWGLHSCSHDDDAGVVCSGTAVRLSIIPLPIPLLLGLVASVGLTLLMGAAILFMRRRPRPRAFLHSAGNGLELNSLGTPGIQGSGQLTAVTEVAEEPRNEVWLVKAKRMTLTQDKPEGGQEKN